uniref:Putative E3 ubiquitin-protein ligase HERC1 n=1 Tax=Noccaea caerulescens TaxID=107243 RepID=A0A1J3JX88_NOCCA
MQRPFVCSVDLTLKMLQESINSILIICQVATEIYSTAFLSREGHVYTAGWNDYGQRGHGDTMKRQVPTVGELVKNIGPVVQISAGPYYVRGWIGLLFWRWS